MAAAAELKRTGKKTLKRVLAKLGRPAGPNRTCILTYHSVGSRAHEMNVAPAAFRAQLEWLAEHRCIVSLREAIRGAEGVAITFDDGYADNLLNAAPILLAVQASFTVFMVAGAAGNWLAHDARTDDARLMTWEELREMESCGAGIGNHTLTHARLSRLDAPGQRREILDAARLLEDRLGHAIEAFAYPYGSAADYNARSVQLVQEAGHAHAVSNRYGTHDAASDPWQARRIWIDCTDTLESFKAKVDGRLDALAILESRAGLYARRALNRLLRADRTV